MKLVASLLTFCAISSAGPSGVTEKVFRQIASVFEKVYQPLFHSHHASLNFVRDWNDSSLEAHAIRKGDGWTVYLAGGLARKISSYALTYTLCHEFGHQVGGNPFNNLPGVEWMSVVDPIAPHPFGESSWLWTLLKTPAAMEPWKGVHVLMLYPLIPWLGILLVGYSVGPLYSRQSCRRRQTRIQRMSLRYG